MHTASKIIFICIVSCMMLFDILAFAICVRMEKKDRQQDDDKDSRDKNRR